MGGLPIMTGVGRNSDVGVILAYPPLFFNVNPGGMQWSFYLFGFYSLTSYSSPRYSAQGIFPSGVGDHTLNSTVFDAGDRFFYSVTSSPNKLCLKLVNASSNDQSVTISWNGLGTGKHTAHIETMKAKSTWATNTISNSQAIVPVKS